MQIVIDIPEKEYELIMQSDGTVFADLSSKECMLHAIKNGTPLPKGHGRLIDAEALKKDADYSNYDGYYHAYSSNAIYHAPTIVEAETK